MGKGNTNFTFSYTKKDRKASFANTHNVDYIITSSSNQKLHNLIIPNNNKNKRNLTGGV